MPLPTGTQLGPYRIIDQIGSGGMGEVYRATDTKLGRDIAIKTLPTALAQEPDRLARFEREAKLLATLNHAHIGAIYGLDEHEGIQFIAMELVEGQMLEDRLKDGALPVADALQIALQIAEALEAAHDKGVVHRDLKPANIMLTPDGVVKVLDFGLAKAFSGDPNEASPAHSPALSLAMTQQGLILGTAGYMSPEQASGQATDQRADIWAFGVVLYEMLTGLPLFSGESVPHILADVLRTDPDWNRLPKNLHPRLRLLLERCLKKKVRDRYHSIADARVDIEDVLRDPEGQVSPTVAQPQEQSRVRRFLPHAGTALAASVVTGLAAWHLVPPSETRDVNRFDYDAREDQVFSAQGRTLLAISPNGRQIVYNGNGGLYVRGMGELDARLIPGTAPTRSSPTFSPDSQSIAYWEASGQLKRIAISGGAAIPIADIEMNPYGVSWGADGSILVGQPDGIFRVPATGGTPELIVVARDGERLHGARLLPDGDSVLFAARPVGETWDTAQITVQSLATGERKVLVAGGTEARFLPTGHLVYAVGSGLFAVAFDLDKIEVSGGAVPIVQNVMRATNTQSGGANFDVSNDGTLVYAEDAFEEDGRALAWVDRTGRETPIGAPLRSYFYPRLSPDGTKLALELFDPERDIWIWDFEYSSLTRFTLDPAQDRFPVWSRDGQRILFASTRSSDDGSQGLYWQAADGTGPIDRVAATNSDILSPTAFTPDGTSVLVFAGQGGSGGSDDIWLVHLDEEGRVEPLLDTSFSESTPALSPDGQWLAYTSDESGRQEVYVRPFPDVEGGRWQISFGGGIQPHWAASGRELFYRTSEALVSVPVQTDGEFERGEAEVLFEDQYFLGRGARAYDVTADGQRFLMVKDLGDVSDSDRIIIVENWFTELERLGSTQ